MDARYVLRLRVEIMQVDDHGMSMGLAGGNLQVTEDVQFGAASFLEIAGVLGRFHELSQEIKAADDGR